MGRDYVFMHEAVGRAGGQVGVMYVCICMSMYVYVYV